MENITLLQSIHELGRIQHFLEYYKDNDMREILDKIEAEGDLEGLDNLIHQMEEHAHDVIKALREAKNAGCLDEVISMVSLKALDYAKDYNMIGNEDLKEAILLNMKKEREDPFDNMNDRAYASDYLDKCKTKEEKEEAFKKFPWLTKIVKDLEELKEWKPGDGLPF